MIGAAHAAGYLAYLPRANRAGTDLNLHTVCDINVEAATELANIYGFTNVETDWQQVIANDQISVISVTLPNMVHEDAVSAALRAGKHVLCEKPLALSAASAHRLAALAAQTTVISGTVFNYRHIPAVADIVARVKRGDLGRLIHISVQHQCDYAADPNLPYSWRYSMKEAGGGALLDIGAHAMNAALALGGPIASIVGAMSNISIPKRQLAVNATTGHNRVALSEETRVVDNDDVFSSVFMFENGCQGTLSASRVAVGYGNRLSFEVSGTEGTAKFSTDRPSEFQFARRTTNAASAFQTIMTSTASPYVSTHLPVPHDGVTIGFGDAFAFTISDFLMAIAENKPMQIGTLEEGAQVADVLQAMQDCARLGTPVTLADVSAAAQLQVSA